MPPSVDHPGGWWNSPILNRLVAAERRHVLAVLLERSGAVGERDLATHIASAKQSKPEHAVTEREAERSYIELRHSHLPVLADADLVVWNRDDGTVSTTDHPALYDPRLRYVLERRDDAWDELVGHLVVERRRIALAILEALDVPITKSALAREVALRETETEPSGEEVEETLLALHHVHLPKLEATGLIEYDDEVVEYSGHPELEETWFDARPHEADRAGRHRPAQ